MDAVLSSVWDRIREGRGKKKDKEMEKRRHENRGIIKPALRREQRIAG
jgi:hypothetical protein